jgi:hypothetical protein
LTNYGLILLTDVTQDVLSYMGTHTKVAQDSFMAFFGSLETDFFLNATTMKASKYHLGQEHTPSGALLLKVSIIMRVTLAHNPLSPSFARLYPSWMPQ